MVYVCREQGRRTASECVSVMVAIRGTLACHVTRHTTMMVMPTLSAKVSLVHMCMFT